MAHSPHAHILEQARLSLAPGHVARRAHAYLIALASRSAVMITWENHASVIPPTPLSGRVTREALRAARLPRYIAAPYQTTPTCACANVHAHAHVVTSERDDDDLHSQ